MQEDQQDWTLSDVDIMKYHDDVIRYIKKLDDGDDLYQIATLFSIEHEIREI